MVLTTLVRAAMMRPYTGSQPSSSRTYYWKNIFIAGTLVSGITWGVAGIILFPPSSNAHQMITVFTIGGMVAGASATYSAIQAAFFAFSLPAMVPVIVNSLRFQDDIHIAMSVMLVLFLMLMIATCRRNNKTIESAIRLGFKNQDLLDFLLAAKNRAESANQQLQDEIVERQKVEDQLEIHQKQLESMVAERTTELQNRNLDLEHEIKERSRIEHALRDSEERYRLLIENVLVGILLIKDQKIEFANTFISVLSAYANEEIVHQPFIDFIHPEDRELTIANHLKRLRGEDFNDTYTIRMMDKKNEAHWVEINAVRLSHELSPEVLVLVRDITQQRMLESQLLHNEKMASIGQLAAGVAHEINNPVGFVNSNLYTLGKYQKEIEQLVTCYRETISEFKALFDHNEIESQVLDKIKYIEALEDKIDLDYVLEDCPQLLLESREGAERIKKIVCDLKDFAHPGKEEIQPLDVNQNIESTLNIVWNELKYHVEVIKDFGPVPEINGNPQQLSQVFMNLLVNAGQAMKDKGQITIQTRAVKNKIIITFSDTGCGIPEENLLKVFDPFFTTKPVGKGTGLGLNVSYNIIQNHQGSIYVASREGEGTTFTIHLPV